MTTDSRQPTRMLQGVRCVLYPFLAVSLTCVRVCIPSRSLSIIIHPCAGQAVVTFPPSVLAAVVCSCRQPRPAWSACSSRWMPAGRSCCSCGHVWQHWTRSCRRPRSGGPAGNYADVLFLLCTTHASTQTGRLDRQPFRHFVCCTTGTAGCQWLTDWLTVASLTCSMGSSDIRGRWHREEVECNPRFLTDRCAFVC